MRFSASPPLLLLRRLTRTLTNHGPRAAVTHSWNRLVRSLRTHGIRGTWERAFIKAPQAPPLYQAQPPHPFDLKHGTDTSGYITGDKLQGTSLSSLYGQVYFAISPSTLAQAIAALPCQLDQFTFVDLGCGKGRAVLVAAQFPFRHILGVEIAPELCSIAQANVDTNPDLTSRVSILNHDAATITYPETPLVIFLYHPFFAPVLRRALANLERQLRRAPREVYLLYADNPRYPEVLARFPFLREMWDTQYPLSAEDAAAQLTQITRQSYTLYSADLSP